MKNYISDKIIHVTKGEKLYIYFKTRVVGEIFCGIFFVMNDIDIH